MLRHMSTVVGPALNRGLMSASRAIARAADHVEPGRQQQGHLPTAEEELVFDIGERLLLLPISEDRQEELTDSM